MWRGGCEGVVRRARERDTVKARTSINSHFSTAPGARSATAVDGSTRVREDVGSERWGAKRTCYTHMNTRQHGHTPDILVEDIRHHIALVVSEIEACPVLAESAENNTTNRCK